MRLASLFAILSPNVGGSCKKLDEERRSWKLNFLFADNTLDCAFETNAQLQA